MAKRRPCMTCEVTEKARGNARDCHECWLAKQPAHVQAELAELRLALTPPEFRVAVVPKEHWPAGRRWCAGCQTFVRLEYVSGKSARCKGCSAGRGREYRLERDYSISKKEYDALFKAQGGRCYLCRRRSVRVPLAVDHNHLTGEVRGLLCPDPEYGCNLKVIARFDADPDPIAMARRLVEYLTDPPARRILHR